MQSTKKVLKELAKSAITLGVGIGTFVVVWYFYSPFNPYLAYLLAGIVTCQVMRLFYGSYLKKFPLLNNTLFGAYAFLLVYGVSKVLYPDEPDYLVILYEAGILAFLGGVVAIGFTLILRTK